MKNLAMKRRQLFHAYLLGLAVPVFLMGRAEKLVLIETDNAKTVRVSEAQTIEVRLGTQAGTGYTWTLNRSKTSNLTLLRESESKAQAGGAAGVGRPLTQVFSFRAGKEGPASLSLSYLRPWEKNQAPAKTFDVKIEVTAAIKY